MLPIQGRKSKLTFQSGLNNNLIRLQSTFNCKQAEEYLNKQGIKSDFLQNKPMALSINLAASILNRLNNAFSFFYFWSPNINVYNKEALLLDSNLYHFCIPECKKVLSNKPEFEKASIFYSDIKNLEALDFQAEQAHKYKIKPSSHFLTDIIHEMMHAIYVNKIYQKYGDNAFSILQNLQNKHFGKKENEVIGDILGKAATEPLNQYHEVFADTFTKAVCNSLDEKDCMPCKNPFDLFKEYPKEFISIIRKIINI